MMGGDLYEDYPTATQPILPNRGDVPMTIARFGAPGMLPVGNLRVNTPTSPLSIYKWEVAEQSLRQLQQVEEDPHDGTILEYVNPVTGGHATPTLAMYLQLLRRGSHLKAHRHSTNSIYFVVRGAGSTVIEGKEYKWRENDLMAIPSWRWHEHIATEETFLFSFTDLPVREAVSLQHSEPYASNGGYQQLSVR
jgi:gentisate 1,2-dioxygenase